MFNWVQLQNILVRDGLKIVLLIVFCAFYVEFFSSAKGSEFADRYSYLARLEALDRSRIEYDLDYRSMRILTSEQGWVFVLTVIANHFADPARGLDLIGGLIAFSFSLFCYRRVPFLLIPIFMSNPVVVDFVMSQQRNALAVGMLLIGIRANRWSVFGMMAVLAQSIHASSIIVVGFLLSAVFLERHSIFRDLRMDKVVLPVFLGFVGAWMVVVLQGVVLSRASDHRVDLSYGAGSWAYASFWIASLLVFCVFQGRQKRVFAWESIFVVEMLALYIVFTFLDYYNNRFLAILFPVYLCAVRGLPLSHQIGMYSILFMYQIVQYSYWW